MYPHLLDKHSARKENNFNYFEFFFSGMWGARMEHGKRKQFREIMEELVEAAKEQKLKHDFIEEFQF